MSAYSSMPQVEWRVIPFAQSYEVSEYGDVRRAAACSHFPAGRPLKPTKAHDYGYPRFKLSINGKHKVREAHALVAAAFLEPRPFPKAEVAHLDGIPTHNHYSNLKWKTHLDNLKDMREHGTLMLGEKNHASILKAADIPVIRQMYPASSCSEISRKYGVASDVIQCVIKRKTWAHIE
jgi:hypothetical protein